MVTCMSAEWPRSGGSAPHSWRDLLSLSLMGCSRNSLVLYSFLIGFRKRCKYDVMGWVSCGSRLQGRGTMAAAGFGTEDGWSVAPGVTGCDRETMQNLKVVGGAEFSVGWESTVGIPAHSFGNEGGSEMT